MAILGLKTRSTLVPVGSYSTIMMLGLRLNTSRLPLGRTATAATLPNCSPLTPVIWVPK
jgi:hypothetical protein